MEDDRLYINIPFISDGWGQEKYGHQYWANSLHMTEWKFALYEATLKDAVIYL